MLAPSETSAFVKRRLIVGVMLALGVLVALLCTAATASADEPGYGLVRCDSPDALKYRESETPIPTGHVLSDGTPVCHTPISKPGPVPYSQAQIVEMSAPPSTESLAEHAKELYEQYLLANPDYIPYQRATNAAPVPHDEWDDYDFVSLGLRGTCGGKYAPRDVGWNELRLGYLCDRNTDRWVKVLYARVAAMHEMIWYPQGPCSRQIHGTDPFRNELVTMRNDDFSEAACQAWLEKLLIAEFASRKEAAGGGRPDPYCMVIGVNTIGLDEDENPIYAYGQVFHNQPDGNGNCLSSPVYWGSYSGAVRFLATDTRCGGSGAVGTSTLGGLLGKWIAANQLRSTLPPNSQGNIRTPRNQVNTPVTNQVNSQLSSQVNSQSDNQGSGSGNPPATNPPTVTKPPEAKQPVDGNDPIDHSIDASDPCDQPFQVPGSYVPGQGCESR